MSDDVLGYLCCDPFAPLELKPGVRYVLGRVKGRDMVLAHHSISREHAVITVEDGKILFLDQSSNGSYVNGKRVEKQVVLAIGDTISLGPYELKVSQSAAADASEQTLSMDFGSMVAGRIQDEPLVQTLQTLEFNTRTGVLDVLSGKQRGHLFMRNGKPVLAEMGDARDQEAVYQLLGLTEGKFVFTPMDDPSAEERMNTSITALLLEWHRRTDEAAGEADGRG